MYATDLQVTGSGAVKSTKKKGRDHKRDPRTAEKMDSKKGFSGGRAARGTGSRKPFEKEEGKVKGGKELGSLARKASISAARLVMRREGKVTGGGELSKHFSSSIIKGLPKKGQKNGSRKALK